MNRAAIRRFWSAHAVRRFSGSHHVRKRRRAPRSKTLTRPPVAGSWSQWRILRSWRLSMNLVERRGDVSSPQSGLAAGDETSPPRMTLDSLFGFMVPMQDLAIVASMNRTENACPHPCPLPQAPRRGRSFRSAVWVPAKTGSLLSLRLFFGQLTPFRQTLFYFFLHSLVARFVIALLRPKIILSHEMLRKVMRVFVPFAMA